jgi:molybdopterin-synthase adenylyltransferase
MFNFEDTRYNRQEQMPEWGYTSQEKLRSAKVVVIGAGGVKSTLLMSLVAAGIGRLQIIEFDTVELSNLNRQILYKTSDIGRNKIDACVETLRAMNPEISIEGINSKVTKDNIHLLCKDFDFIVEGGDSPAGRNLVNEYCLTSGIPFVHASAQFNYGYVVSVIPKYKTACFACYFPTDFTRNQSTGPVPVSVLSTSVAGTLCAAEVIKWFTDNHDKMYLNKRLCFSSLLLSGEFSVVDQPRLLDCKVCSRYYDLSHN